MHVNVWCAVLLGIRMSMSELTRSAQHTRANKS